MVKYILSIILKKLFLYQILKLDEDHPSVGAQDFFIVTSVFTIGLGHQQNQQDSAEQSSGQTL